MTITKSKYVNLRTNLIVRVQLLSAFLVSTDVFNARGQARTALARRVTLYLHFLTCSLLSCLGTVPSDIFASHHRNHNHWLNTGQYNKEGSFEPRLGPRTKRVYTEK